MKQYVVTGYDFTDEGAIQRRLDVRPHHMDGVRAIKESGNLVAAAALLNDNGDAIGSVMILQFETDEQLEGWKMTEPYFTQGIWETVDIKPARVPAL